ncbi:apses-domain-containing protein, partial [Rhizodiscina lignyota]
MNTIQPAYDVHQSHMSQHTSGPPSGLGHYSHYPQPPLLQPGPQTYSSAPNSYSQYPYGGGMNQSPAHPVTSSMGSAMLQQALPLPAMASQAGTGSMQGAQSYPPHQFDTTGQIAPPGVKPRVTATLWEDEGSLCFQVEAKGVCVARREDNHMINGTKLLNVAGMTRGRRDGILKSEKVRHVVKIGPMHLKGVWIPFDRALDFANKEKITDVLYPLFVHDIGALLYHPTNQSRANVSTGAMAAVDRSRTQQRYLPATQSTQAPPLHHHHSMSNPMNQAPPNSIAPHPAAGRPGLDRAHTFPTPPTSASSVMGMSNQYGSSEWSASGVSGMQNTQQLSIDTGLSNTRSVPTTPATTPPGNAIGSMQQYPTTQSYDTSRQVYTAPPTQTSPYGTQVRYGQVQPGQYPKTEMAPPARAGEGEQGDIKPPDMMGQPGTHVPHGEEEAEHEQSEYTHTQAPYSSTRDPYNYAPGPPQGAIHGEPQHMSPELASSPHQNGSGRATPRTTATSQTQWSGQYGTPQRAAPASNLYNVMDNRGAPVNGADPGYPTAGYPSQAYAAANGGSSVKRGREDDDQDYRPDSRDTDDIKGLKRRKTDTMGGAVG